MSSRVLCVIVLAGCASASRRDPISDARARVRSAAEAVIARDHAALALLVAPVARPQTTEEGAKLSDAELRAEGEALRQAADGPAHVRERARIEGPLGLEITLDRGSEGWRVDPESLSGSSPTPTAALAQLVAALDRLEADAALALLSGTLRRSLVGAARERARGLRELLLHVQPIAGGQLAIRFEYGHGLFVVLRRDLDGWRVDDFN